MSDEYLFGGTSELKQSETEIRHLFAQYISVLCNQKWKIVDQITEWSNTLIRQIQEYVTEQRNLLGQIYEQKVHYIENIRDKVVEQALIHEQRKESEQIQQLLNQCNNLKFELATLVYMERPISSIQLITEEQITQQNRDEHQTDDEQSRKKRIKDHDNNMIHNTDITEISPPKLTLTNTNQSSPIPKSSSNTKNQSVISDHTLENSITPHNTLAEKCPICFMIFPQNMTTHDRNLHVNEHYKDD